jgi:thioesterase domain-containing protein
VITELGQYLHEHIPLSRAMEVSVISCTEQTVVLSAPLAPNINHRETVFGGSASAVAILAAWSLLHTRLRDADIEARLVIQRNSMNYELPIQGTFTASSLLEEPAHWASFVRLLSRKGKARIAVTARLEYDGQIVGRFTGEFVALNGRDA